jgi:hypothetical protein
LTTPAERQAVLDEIRADQLRLTMLTGHFAMATYRGAHPITARARRERLLQARQMREEAMSSAAERAAQLAQMAAEDSARDARLRDQAHLPGSGEPVIDRVGYWERATGAAEARWDGLDRQVRAAIRAYGEFPDSAEGAEIACLQAAADAAWAERCRARGHRDAALAELEAARAPLHRDW